MKSWIMGAVIVLLFILLLLVPAPQAQDAPHIIGKSLNYDWEIEVYGSQGVFRADGDEWPIEFFLETPGLGGYLRVLSFLGRKEDNFINVHVFLNYSGEDFFVNYYNYKDNALLVDSFEGSYHIIELEAAPTLMEGYVPTGKVPNYEGQDFRISSQFAEISPAQGRVFHPQLQLVVYPVYNVVISSSWSEFWMIGVDPSTHHTYFLIFYTTPSAWVIDLWSGAVEALPLGRAIVIGDYVRVERNVRLETK